VVVDFVPVLKVAKNTSRLRKCFYEKKMRICPFLLSVLIVEVALRSHCLANTESKDDSQEL